MPRKTDKRVRLIEAAKALIHKKGFNITTLADIAQEADVPLGNVYYYFKTKEAIGVAVIEKRAQEWVERLASWSSQYSDALTRIMALLHYNLEDLDTTARYGCPVGGLCQELGKQGGPLADLAAKLLHDMLRWSEDQFSKLGFGEKAPSYALDFISTLQGMLLLTHTFKEPKLAQKQAESLQLWLESITNRKAEAPAVRAIERVEEDAFA